MLGVPGEGEAEQDACPPPKARSHSLKYQLCALHAMLIHRVMLHAALHEEEHKCYLAALLCGQQPVGAAGQGIFQPSWLNPPAKMSQSQALLRPYCWESCHCSHWGKTPVQWKKTQNVLGKYLLVSFRGEECDLSVVRKSRVSLTPVSLGYFCLVFEVMSMLHHHFQCSGWKLITEWVPTSSSTLEGGSATVLAQ